MNQNEIEAFNAVAECGSISAAAQQLYTGQTTISARIQTLENELGVTLFMRGRGQRNTELTPQGRRFEEYARKWEQLLTETQNAVKKDPASTLNIASTQLMSSYIVPEVYRRLASINSESSVRLWNYHLTECYQMVESDAAEIGFVSTLHFSKDLNVHPLYSENLVLIYAPGSSYADISDPSELDPKNEIYTNWYEEFVRWHNYWFRDQAAAIIETNDIRFIENTITLKDKWALVPITMAESLRQRGLIDYSVIGNVPTGRKTNLICKNSIESYTGLSRLLELMEPVVTGLKGEWIYEKQH